MRISITTDEGEVVEIIPGEDIGDLSKSMARADLMETITAAVERAAEKEASQEDSAE